MYTTEHAFWPSHCNTDSVYSSVILTVDFWFCIFFSPLYLVQSRLCNATALRLSVVCRLYCG